MGKDSKKEPKGRGVPLDTYLQSKAYVQQVDVPPFLTSERVEDSHGRYQSAARPPRTKVVGQELPNYLHQEGRVILYQDCAPNRSPRINRIRVRPEGCKRSPLQPTSPPGINQGSV